MAGWFKIPVKLNCGVAPFISKIQVYVLESLPSNELSLNWCGIMHCNTFH